MSGDPTLTRASAEGRSYDSSRKMYLLFLAVGFVMLFMLVFLSLTSGNYRTSPQDVLRAFTHPGANPQVYSIVVFSRIPRLLAAIVIGAALSVSGLVFQNIFLNHMASPDILGVSSGAGFGASLAIFFGFGSRLIWIFSFVGGIAAVGLTTAVSSLFRRDAGRSVTLILSGIIIGGLMNSAIGLLKYLSNDAQLGSITYWLLGGLYHTKFDHLMVAVPVIAVGVICLYLHRWEIIVLRNGATDAQTHGIDSRRARFAAIFFATLITAMSVSVGGTIGWIGLAVPNMIKVLLKDQDQYAMPLVILYGMSFTVLSDLLARTLSMSEIPIGIITGILGSMVFILVLLVGRRQHG